MLGLTISEGEEGKRKAKSFTEITSPEKRSTGLKLKLTVSWMLSSKPKPFRSRALIYTASMHKNGEEDFLEHSEGRILMAWSCIS